MTWTLNAPRQSHSLFNGDKAAKETKVETSILFYPYDYVASVELSIANPMVFRPLSTYTTEPVTAEASGDTKKAAVLPTSSVEGILFDIKNMVRKWEESDTHCAWLK